IGRAVAVNPGVGVFDLVEHGPDVDGRHGGVREKTGELLEGALEVDVVLPEGVVGVDDQVLFHLPRGRRRKGISITTSTSTGVPSRRAGSNCHFRSAAIALLSSRGSRPLSTLMPYT